MCRRCFRLAASLVQKVIDNAAVRRRIVMLVQEIAGDDDN